MKIGLLVVSVIGLSVTCTTWANDFPSLGYSPGRPVKDLVAKGYWWVTVNGPYACEFFGGEWFKSVTHECRLMTSYLNILRFEKLLPMSGVVVWGHWHWTCDV